MYPKIMNAIPKYQQMLLHEKDRLNCFHTIVSPTEETQGMSVYQDAWVHLSKIEKGIDLNYKLRKKENGVYAFLISGNVESTGYTCYWLEMVLAFVWKQKHLLFRQNQMQNWYYLKFH
jgi:hypothetical protein